MAGELAGLNARLLEEDSYEVGEREPPRFTHQLRLLLWKNWLLRKRTCGSTCTGIMLPVIVMLLMVLLRSVTSSDNIIANTQGQYYRPMLDITMVANISYRQPFSDVLTKKGPHMLAVAPTNHTMVARMLEHIRLKCIYANIFDNQTAYDYITGYETETALEDYIKGERYGNDDEHPVIDIAIVMEEIPTNGGTNWSYAIRMKSTRVPDTNPDINHDQFIKFTNDWNEKYYEDGFTAAQAFVDAYITYVVPLGPNVSIESTLPLTNPLLSILPMAVPDNVIDPFFQNIKDVTGMLFIIAFLYPVSRLIRDFVEEKETRIKEGMKIMGLKDSVFWTSWFITALLLFTITSLIVTSIAQPNVFKHSDFGLVFLYFWCFTLSMISFASLASTFFSKAKVASTVGTFLFFGAFLPYYAVNSDTASNSAKVGACILAPACFALGTDSFITYEGAQVGVKWDNYQHVTNNFAFSSCLSMMIFDFFFYALLTWYFDKVLPSEVGTHQPPWFFLKPSYWSCGIFQPSNEEKERQFRATVIGQSGLGNDKFEQVNEEVASREGVFIRDLDKIFPSDKGQFIACNKINLDMYQGQVFALLGHNGAGKTTLMSTIIGLYEIDNGDAFMYGKSVKHDLTEIRQNLGFCPQHDILFNKLTLREHLQLYAQLKGVPERHIAAAVNEKIEQMQMQASADVLAEELSGGEKRKLSCAIALIGPSKVVFLDEPTSGMDPYSRRATWELIKTCQGDKVIVLTTHFMDEADLLGDRIAIMSKGVIQCCGTSLFLKSIYGVGYTLTVTFDNSIPGASESIEKMVHTHLDDVEVNTAGTEMQFKVPLEASKHFAELFEEFDKDIDASKKRQSSIGVRNYGVSVTTLEEVFLKVGHDKDSHDPNHMSGNYENISQDIDEAAIAGAAGAAAAMFATTTGQHDHDGSPHHSRNRSNSTGSNWEPDMEDARQLNRMGQPMLGQKKKPTKKPVKSKSMFWEHFRALFKKRFKYSMRDRKALIFQLFIPIFALVLGLGLLKISPSALTYPTYVFDGFGYKQPAQFVYNNDTYLHTTEIVNGSFPPGLYDLIPTPLDTNNSHNPIDFNQILLDTRMQVNGSRQGGLFISKWFDSSPLPNLNYTVLFNTTNQHTLPTFINVANTIILNAKNHDNKHHIHVSSHPFPVTSNEKAQRESMSAIVVATLVTLAFCFVPASFAVFVVRERETHAKHQQLISGVSPIAYWASTYAWDVVNYMITCSVAIIIMLIFNDAAFVGSNLPATILLFVLYGISIIPMTYCFSFAFDSHSTAQSVLMFVYFCTGNLMLIVSFVLSTIDSTKNANWYLGWFYRLFPNYCLGQGLLELSVRKLYSLNGLITDNSVFAWDITGYNLLYMAICSVCYFISTLLLESIGDKWNGCTTRKTAITALRMHRNKLKREVIDQDVAAEKERVRLGKAHDAQDVIIVEGLSKVYTDGEIDHCTVATDDLHFGIPKGECFGFLGTSGSGKTTTLGILGGEITPTVGTAYLQGIPISNHLEVRRLLGYCPQENALFDLLTGREHLELYSRIKGLPEAQVAEMCTKMMEYLSLQQYADRPAGTYSGGNKRKLSVAISLIGNPPIILLDEPSTGIDPVSRRFMWNFISSTMANRSVMITTHSMEECEALCHRLTVIVDGRIKCIGTPSHLKQRFGQGYQLDLNTAPRPEAVQILRNWVEHTFKGANIVEFHGGLLKYSVPPVMSMGQMFATIEANRKQLEIREYSVSQTSLEQIFILMARAAEMKKANVSKNGIRKRSRRQRQIQVQVDEQKYSTQ